MRPNTVLLRLVVLLALAVTTVMTSVTPLQTARASHEAVLREMGIGYNDWDKNGQFCTKTDAEDDAIGLPHEPTDAFVKQVQICDSLEEQRAIAGQIGIPRDPLPNVTRPGPGGGASSGSSPPDNRGIGVGIHPCDAYGVDDPLGYYICRLQYGPNS